MAELVATMAIGPLVSMLKNKVSSYLLDKYNVMEGMEEQHKILKRRLPIILDVIIDIKEQAMVHRDGVKAWLRELKTVACEANEVFNEFKYEALRRDAKKNGHYTKLGFDVIKLFPTHNRVVFRHRMGRKLCRILQAIEVLIAEMHAFMFSYQPQPPVSKQWRQTDYVMIVPEEIASRFRHKEKMNIVDVLLGQTSNADLTVVPIIGMGGLGKTTLAQLIYNEPEIQNHFQLLIWVCVSDTFDVNSLAKCIVEASPNKDADVDKPPLDRLQNLVSGQRYLLVLDDVWNGEVHKWERLKVCLQHGGCGSAVLTTTHDKVVAEIMGADKVYNLNILGDSFIKEIIEARAFGLKKKKPGELVDMVDEIVKTCSGFPLAAAALGSVLHTKTSVEEWKDISVRSSICTEETGILPILKLSYDELSSQMKKCFAFCAVFPRNYEIDVQKLIQLWIANGFIPEQKEYTLEAIGKHIFNELASRSFFLDIKESRKDWKYYSITTCKIHGLMHDIAASVMEEQGVVATKEPSQIKSLPDIARHLFLSREAKEGSSNKFVEKRSHAIQTLICDNFMGISLRHLSKYNSLHALKLRIVTESFLLEPKYLRHLRYLDLSGSRFKALPEDISILYNLQMLDLSNCLYLDRLPRQMKYMTSLRHLYTHGCPELRCMPPELGKLGKLQTLTCFVAAIAGPDCSDISELQHLNLGGQLELCQVENISKAELIVANLSNKKDLRELTLRWTYVCDSNLLSNFEPHDGLQVLRICFYGGRDMGTMQNMVQIHLFHCERLQVLFRCDTPTFPKLKELTLEYLFDLDRWWDINERQKEQITFPVLEKFFIRHCRKLVAFHVCSTFPALKALKMENLDSFQGWDVAVEREQIFFPQLEKLSIQKCPKLIALPEAPLLQQLELTDMESFQRWDAVEGTQGEEILFPQLEKLSIQKCPKLIDLPKAPKLGVLQIVDVKQEIFHWVDRYLSSLNYLILKLEYTETTSEAECTSIELVHSKEKWNQKSPLSVMKLRCCNSFFGSGTLEPWDYLVHLEDLEIVRCNVLIHWPEKVFQSLVSLRRLEIAHCHNLTGYAEAPLEPPASERSQHLPGLESLELHYCASLVEMFNVPASLKRMNITECPNLESILGKQQGMSELVQGSSCSDAIVHAAVSELPSSPMDHFCPCLEDLSLSGCGSLAPVLNLPLSLKTILISGCSSIQVLRCQVGGLQRPEVTTSINVPEPSTAGAAAQEHSLPLHLQSLKIWWCDGMLGGILCLPMSVNYLTIVGNSGFTSLESLSAEHPPSFDSLYLRRCSTLASLPIEPHAYRFLRQLTITGCPAIKKLPRCLQQQLEASSTKN